MLLVIDPPWPKKKGGLRATRPNQGKDLDYATMPIPDIFQLLDREIFPQAPHTVFLWTIDQFLIPASLEMDQRGYRLHARLIWDKTNGVAPAFSVRFTHEYLLWYYKGAFLPVTPRGVYPTVIREKARQHSRKPDAAYRMIEALYPGVPKMDVFSREKRPGWDQWGNQVDYFGS